MEFKRYLVPQPQDIKINSGSAFNFNNKMIIKTNSVLNKIHIKAIGEVTVEEKTGLKYLVIGEETNLPTHSLDHLQAYTLTVYEKSCVVVSHSDEGLYYGFNTLCQILERQTEIPACVITDFPEVEKRYFHLELRWGFPSFERILEIIDEVSHLRYNGILVEYEDHYPFTKHTDITHPILKFTKEQLQELFKFAKDRYMPIMPLQQTLGHVEYILKHPGYNDLKEVQKLDLADLYPVRQSPYVDIDEFCMCNEKTPILVDELLDDYIAMHPESEYIHIGCDEAWNLFTCDKCIAAKEKHGANKILLDYINRVADYVVAKGKKPAVWDDMIRRLTPEELAQLNKKMVITIWMYYTAGYDVVDQVSQKCLDAGLEIMGVSAAKASEFSELPHLELPDIITRINNIDMWFDLLQKHKFNTIITTVWSNYTGTIAPPHPFFDTCWIPLVYSAQKNWNSKVSSAEFSILFLQSFFNYTPEQAVDFRTTSTFNLEVLFKDVVVKCTKNEYIAEVYATVTTAQRFRTWFYKIVFRELYKLDIGVITPAERQVLFNKISVGLQRISELSPKLHKLVGRYHSQLETDEYVQSRFTTTKFILEHYLTKAIPR